MSDNVMRAVVNSASSHQRLDQTPANCIYLSYHRCGYDSSSFIRVFSKSKEVL